METKKGFLVLAIVLLLVAQPILSAKILGYLLTPGRSHFIISDSLLQGLAAKGHDVSITASIPELLSEEFYI